MMAANKLLLFESGLAFRVMDLLLGAFGGIDCSTVLPWSSTDETPKFCKLPTAFFDSAFESIEVEGFGVTSMVFPL